MFDWLILGKLGILGKLINKFYITCVGGGVSNGYEAGVKKKGFSYAVFVLVSFKKVNNSVYDNDICIIVVVTEAVAD